MIKNLYTVRDVKTSFADPFADVSDEAAIRGFKYMIANQPNIIGFAPEDFSLWKVGKFDTLTGVVEYILPKIISHATDIGEE